MSQPGTYAAKIRGTVEDLNALLKNISVPVVLESPHDLTPSLLIVALELILQDRLPISQATRTAKDVDSRVEAMEALIEALYDALEADNAALREMDPRMLAIGEWDEVVTVAEALVAVGRANGLVSESSGYLSEDISLPQPTKPMLDTYTLASEDESVDPFWVPRLAERSVFSPRLPVKNQGPLRISTHSTTSGSTSFVSDRLSSSSSGRPSGPTEPSFAATTHTVSSGSPIASYRSDGRSYETGSSSRSRPTTSSSTSTKSVPRCIHEVGEVEEDISQSFDESVSFTKASICDSSFLPPTRQDTAKSTPVRYTGWIEPVDDEEEIRAFEARRNNNFNAVRSPTIRSPLRTRPDYGGLSIGLTPKTPSALSPGRVLTRHTSPSQHTLALMNERAKLLEELASLKAAKLR